MADMMAGIVSKLLKGLSNSLRYQSFEEGVNKKILDTKWFRLNETQLRLYKKLYWLICKCQPACYKSCSGIYSDDLIAFYAFKGIYPAGTNVYWMVRLTRSGVSQAAFAPAKFFQPNNNPNASAYAYGYWVNTMT